MDCGVVPVQVDEVAIWPPTKKQLKTRKANAYANVHRRGLRTSESTVQMTSAEDGEMIMEIVNMRATAYEAAVPQKPESTLKEAPYGKIAWELDFDTVENREGLTTADLVRLALFKYPSYRIVELGTENAANILRKSPRSSYTVVVTSDEELETAESIVAEYRNARVVKIDPTHELESQGLKKESYDILIGGAEESGLLVNLSSVLKTGASVINSDGTITLKVADERPASGEHSIQLVYRSTPSSIISNIKTALEALKWDVTVTSLSASISSTIAEHVIMLADFEGPLLFTLLKDEFQAIQNIIAKTSSLLWVSTGGILDGKKPEYAMVSGLARAITSEQASIDFRTPDIDTDKVNPGSIIQSVAKVAQSQVDKAEECPEREFCVSNGKTYISRLIRNHDLNGLYTSPNQPKPKSFNLGDRISGIVMKTKVVFQQQDEKAAIDSDHVEVQVHCSGLTKEGVMAITGSDYATTFSHEVGGVVKRVGSGSSGFKAGDRVVGFSVGHFNSYQHVPTTMLLKLEEQEDMPRAVSNLTAYATALYGLETLAAVRKGENVLVLNKTGFAGAAAINIAQRMGANLYAVAKTDEEIHFLQHQLRLDASHIIKPSDGLVSERLEQLTDGHGADVVFSAGGSVDKAAAHEAWRCIAPFGRFLDSGRKGALSRTVLDGVPIQRNASYMPFDILDIYRSRPDLVSKALPTIVEYSNDASRIIPGMVRLVGLGDLDHAVSDFSDSFGAVKSIIQYKASNVPIQTLSTRANKFQLRSDATYVLVGCLGGLGRSLTSWMMESGARRFTFLSRSGADAKFAAKLVGDLEAKGAFVQVVRGDATSRADVVRAVEGIPSQYPIRGVVHAAMVLRVS